MSRATQALTREYHELKTSCKRFRVSAEELTDARSEQMAKVDKARDALAAERKRHEQYLATLFQKTCADMGAAMEDIDAKQAALKKRDRDQKKKFSKGILALLGGDMDLAM